MRKFLLSSMLLSAMFFVGCSNENSVNPKPELGTATIKGTAYADLDYTTDGDEKVPSGTIIIATVNTRDLAVVPTNQTYANKSYQTTVDGNGQYSFEIEVGLNPITVSIAPQDFNHDVKTGDSTTESINFIGSTKSRSVIKGGSYIVDLFY